MSDVVISVERLSKRYRLGQIGRGTLRSDLSRWWASLHGRSDPTAKIGRMVHVAQGVDDLWAIRDIDFQVREGERLGIIGANGAGKSTLLKTMSRITAPTTGCIRVRGRIASLLEVGTGFHGELTGRENIFLNGAILGMTRAEIRAKLDEIVAFSGVEEFIDTPVKRYSSGMTVRLAFSVAAHLDAEILILDEVLAVGDLEFQRKCLDKLLSVSDSGRTILFVSHNLETVRTLCGRAILLRQGLLQDDGTAKQVISAYTQHDDRSHLACDA